MAEALAGGGQSHAGGSAFAQRPCGRFCFGDEVTLADICLVPHLTTAGMLYELELHPFPTAERIFRNCMELDAFAKTQPRLQPAPRATNEWIGWTR